MDNVTEIRLVADIGGTNIRIAQATKNNQLTHVSTYKCADFAELSDVLKLYIAEQEIAGKALHACLAIACPTDEDWISMTNLPWAFSQTALKAELSLQSLYLINDYKAIAMSVPFLNDKQKCHIRGPQVLGLGLRPSHRLQCKAIISGIVLTQKAGILILRR